MIILSHIIKITANYLFHTTWHPKHRELGLFTLPPFKGCGDALRKEPIGVEAHISELL